MSSSSSSPRRVHHHHHSLATILSQKTTKTTTVPTPATYPDLLQLSSPNTRRNNNTSSLVPSTTTTTTTTATHTTTNNNGISSPLPKSPSTPKRFERGLPVRINSASSVFSADSSLTSSVVGYNNNDFIYVKDAVYAWLPAEILSASCSSSFLRSSPGGRQQQQQQQQQHARRGSVQVKVILPTDWNDTTALLEDSSIKGLESLNTTKCTTTNNRVASNTTTTTTTTRSSSKSKRRTYKYEKRIPKRTDIRNIAQGVMRTVYYQDFPNGQLPTQNIERYPQSKNNATGSPRYGEVYPGMPSLLNARDMADLTYLHEAAILYNVKLRHGKGMPYTRVGDIMVAVNPFQWIDGLYGFEKQRLYAHHFTWCHDDDNDVREGKGEEFTTGNNNEHTTMGHHDSYFSKLGLEPHVFETASLAYRGLAKKRQDQTILVTGVSGAGKTETIKIVMQNLATMEQTRPSILNNTTATTETNCDEGLLLQQRNVVIRHVLEANAVFEAFGNAKTVRNNNSSRFGRFTQLQFDIEEDSGGRRRQQQQQKYTVVPKCRLTGSTASTYLLEKSRIVGHETEEERTFHIFYQLLAAPEDEKVGIWDGLSGTTNESFLCVGPTDTTSIEGKSDKVAWTRTVEALKLFGFVGDTFCDLMSALCVVLQLGNLKFESPLSSDIEEGGCIITPKEELDKLASLMGIPCEDIRKAMTSRVDKVGKEEITMKLNPTVAKDGCDALAKEIYGLIFNVLVCHINEYTSPYCTDGDVNEGKTHGTINLLDIFGFERFETNRFEQICINYANERLQQKYVLDCFSTTQEEYITEGIELFDFSIIDNSDAVTLFEGDRITRQLCLIALLNEECTRRNGTCNAFVHKLKDVHATSSRLLTDGLHERYEFGIQHFAGFVTYDAQNFIQSNTDHIPDNLMNCARKSTNNLIGGGFSAIILMAKGSLAHGPRRRSGTVLTKFRSQLNKIMDTIKATQPRYIRCIKPNNGMLPRITDHTVTMDQLESSGLVTAISISRETFPNKLYYDVVWDRFQCLAYQKMGISLSQCRKNKTSSFQNGNRTNSSIYNNMLRKDVEELLCSVLVKSYTRSDGMIVPSFQCGKTKVYFRAGALECLETDRLEYYSVHATLIQAWYMCQALRLNYNKLRHAVVIVQTRRRGKVAFTKYYKARHAIVILQARRRGTMSRSRYIKIHCAVIAIQAFWRGLLARSKYLQIRYAVNVLQGITHMKAVRSEFLSMKNAAIVIQTWMRNLYVKYALLAVQTRIREKHALDKYCLLNNAAIVVQKRRRGKIVYLKYREMRHAAIIIQSKRRGRERCMDYFLMRKAAIVSQKVARGEAVRFRLLAMKDAIVIVQAWGRRNSELRKYNLQRKSIIQIQSMWRTALSRSRIRKYKKPVTFQASATRSKPAIGIQDRSRISATRLKPAVGIHETFLNVRRNLILQELAKIRQQNIILSDEVEEIEEDKRGLIHHAQTIEAGVNMARLHSEKLMKANASLITEISDLRHDNVRLGKELILIQKKGDADILSTKKRFRQMMSQRDSEISALEITVKDRPMNREVEVSRLADNMDHQREDHLMEINVLKAKLQKRQDNSYWEKLIDCLETSYSSREAEVDKLSKMLKCLEDEKDTEIRKLEADIISIRTSRHKGNMCMPSIDQRANYNIKE